MSPALRDDYLATEVMTATPQKLQLMLIEAALRLSVKAREHWRNNQPEPAGEALIRCQQIITELMCGLRPENDPELVRKVGAIYAFVFRSLVAAHLKHDMAKLDEVISVLELERDTWRQVCAQLGSTRTATEASDGLEPRASFVA